MRGFRLLPDTVAGAPLRLFTLQFRDPVVEHAFQAEAGERFRAQVLFTIVLGALTWLTAGILIPIVYAVSPTLVAVSVGAVEIAILSQLALLTRSREWNFEQAISGGVNLVGGIAIIMIGGFVADLPQVVPAALVVNMLFAFGLSRLGIVAGILVTLPYI